MLHYVHNPVPFVEEAGDGWFAPVRPLPYQGRPRAIAAIRAARKNILAVWSQSDYDLGSGAARLFSRQVVLANSPQTIKHVMVTAHDNYERKSPQMRRSLELLLGDGLFISDGETWKKRRPLVADIMNKSRLPVFGRTMEEVTQSLAARWAARGADESFDLLTEMAELTAAIIARAVFGNRLGADAAEDVVKGFATYQKRIDSVNIPFFFGMDNGMPAIKGPRLGGAIHRVHRVIDKVIEEHLAGHGDAHSMIDTLVRRQAKRPELGLDVSALRNEAATIFMAGHETTATTLTWAWYCLSKAPWVEKAMLEDITRVCGTRSPTVEDVPQLEWCRAVIEEILRLYPPVPFLTRQAKAADRIGKTDVEPASLIIVSPWLLHRTPQLWDRPNHFLPERFLGDARPEPFSYIPFSAGPRVCAGLAFGLTEAILCLAILAQRFQVTPKKGRRVIPVCRLSLRPEGGMPATVAAR